MDIIERTILILSIDDERTGACGPTDTARSYSTSSSMAFSAMGLMQKELSGLSAWRKAAGSAPDGHIVQKDDRNKWQR